MSPRRFIISFTATCLVFCFLYMAAIRVLSPAPIAAEHWLQGTELVKRQLADDHRSQRILLFGGSSTLFSISAKQMSQTLGIPAINMAMHAGLPLQYYLKLARDVAKPGDTVIVLPEYGYYTIDNPNTDWLERQVLGWNTGYLRTLSWPEFTRLALNMSPRLLIEAAFARMFSSQILASTPDRAMITTDEAMAAFRRGTEENEGRPASVERFRYSFDNLDKHGDIMNNVGTREFAAQTFGLTGTFHKGQAWEYLRSFFSFCRRTGVDCLLGLPPVLESTDKNVDAAMRRGLDQIVEIANDLHISVLDERNDIFFPRSEYFDTSFHLNETGREKRTSGLTRAIQKLSSLGVAQSANR